MVPSQISPSEAWMWRMMEELKDDLGMIVFNSMGQNSFWQSRIPMHSLRPYRSLPWRCLSRWRGETDEVISKKNLLRRIQNVKITHVLCHYGAFAINFMDIWRKIDVPLFVHFHGYDVTFDRRLETDSRKPFFSANYREQIIDLSHRATLIANSHFTRNLLIEAGVSKDRIHVKYLGVPVPAEGKVHTKTKDIHILHLGRLVDFKSPDRTIRAFEIAKERGFDGRLILAGDGAMRVTCELLKARSKWKDSIEILGAVTLEQGQELLSQADIFTQHNIQGEISRQSECFGVSVLEAMAAGLPVIGTRNGGVMETVVDGETGILIEPGDVERQAECFLTLARDAKLRQQFGDAGRKRVGENFSMEMERERFRTIMGLK
jgi:glycosyltransferase involved in cell wall biosynthesis